MNKLISFVLLTLIASCAFAQSPAAAPTTQIAIDRVDLMPNRPTPFKLKDFKAIARGTDKLLFDFDQKGQYLPLIWWDDTHVNTPMRGFGFPSFVGRPDQNGGMNHESITTMGALLGATIAGIDKSKEPGGHNWVEMAQLYFNSANGQNVVLNNVKTETGQTYWYELLPQILFNCLIDRYPDTPRAAEIMRTATDRWYSAYQALKARPGGLNFEHTAFSLAKMEPVDNGKWREPDGAEAMAFVFFSAYRKFGDEKYLAAAKDLMSFTDQRQTNPHYEILHLYGAYLAARMNAEYDDMNLDVGKFINWCFNPSENRPGWGVGVGRWGDYETSGLACGVQDGGGYAFLFNTYVMAGCVVPAVRYDERFARGVGKWMLNTMNSARLFYPDELPPDMQSSPGWKSDPPNVIAYEGLRRVGPKGKSPYATGDAVRFKWGPSDLGIYGSAFVGMFAGIITPGEDPMIPQLDLLACDMFRDRAYPSYLYYNPYDDRRDISVNVGDRAIDIYDAVRNTFVARNVTGSTKVPLEADSAMVLIFAPAGGKETTQGRKTMIDGVVIDYDNGLVPRPQPKSRPPEADLSKTIAANRAPRGTITVDGNADDWSNVQSETLHLDTGGRGTLQADVKLAWDDQYLYVLAKQTAKGEKTNEAKDIATYKYAPWDSDGVWLHLDIPNGRVPPVGDLVLALSLNSKNAADLFVAAGLTPDEAKQIHTATSGTNEAGDRVIEARVPWTTLIKYATHDSPALVERLGKIAPGFRFGCEPLLIEWNIQRQSFIGGAQFMRPTGRDANSRDIVLRE